MSWNLLHIDIGVAGLVIGAVGALLTTVTGVAAYIFYKRSKIIKQLTCTLRDPLGIKFDLDLMKGEAKKNVKVVFGDKNVEKLSILFVDFQNTGNAPIFDKDFEKRFTFEFPADVEVIDGETIDRSPDVEVFREEKGSTTEWWFLSLRSNEHFTIQFLLDGVLRRLPGINYRLPDVRVEVDKPVQSILLTQQWLIGTLTSTILAVTAAAGLAVGVSYIWSTRIWPFPSVLTELTDVVRNEGVFLEASSRVIQRSKNSWEYNYVLRNNGTMPIKEVAWDAARIRVMVIPPGETVFSAFMAPTPPKNTGSTIQYGAGQIKTVTATVPSQGK